MHIEYLKTFIVAAECMSFTRASEYLKISQPAVSMQIRDLEVYLGTELFERHGRSLSLTPAGHRFRLRAARLVNDLSVAKDEALELMGQAGGNLRVGATDTLGNYYLPSRLGSFLADVPYLRTSVVTADEALLARMLLDGALEACLWEGEVPERLRESFDVFLLDQDRIELVVGPAHPRYREATLAVRELVGAPLVMRQPEASIRQYVLRALDEVGITIESLDIRLEVSQTAALKRVLRTLPAYGFASRIAIEDEVSAGELKILEVPELDLRRSLWFLCAADGPRPQRIRALLAFIQRLAAERR